MSFKLPLLEELESFGHRVSQGTELGSYTRSKIGGESELFVELMNLKTLAATLLRLDEAGLPWFVLGHGSHMLIADEGFQGAALWLGRSFSHLSLERDALQEGQHLVEAGAGLPLSKLVDLAEKEGLKGLFPMAEIPGTIGGGLVMDVASAWGSLRSLLYDLDCITKDGPLSLSQKELQTKEAWDKLKEAAIIIKARFLLKENSHQHIPSLPQIREQQRFHLPVDRAGLGPIFLDPEGQSAAQLIDAVGLKGYHVGSSKFSDLNANWIINTAQASARDALALMALAQARVHEKYAISLKPHIVRLGHFLPKGRPS